MSENAVPEEFPTRVLDFTGVTVIGLSGAGLISINGDITPAQLLVGGTQIAVVDGGGGSHTLNVTALASINGDTTPAQTLTSSDSSLIVSDPGAGVHDLIVNDIFFDQFTPAGVPVSIPSGVPTKILTVTLAVRGLYDASLDIHSAGSLGGATANVRAQILQGAAVVAEDFRMVSASANNDGYGCTICSLATIAADGGEIFDAWITQDNSLGAPILISAHLVAQRFGRKP